MTNLIYKNINFENKAEAYWAAFFDLCEIKWTYKSVRFEDWFPTFVLEAEAGKLFVQVSPFNSNEEYLESKNLEYLRSLDISGRKLFLRREFSDFTDAHCLTSGWVEESYEDGTSFEPICWSFTPEGIPDFHAYYGSWKLILSGFYDGDSYAFLSSGEGKVKILSLWKKSVETIDSIEKVTLFRRPIPPSLRVKIFQRDKSRCRLCGTTATRARLEIDHIIPVAKGGTNDESNLQVLCVTCNQGKSDN